ncbi:MAG: LLM class F420-dependent oxidoreductase [Ktedonobacteraceae bacterium]|nr:LLM class F420-dependent oxidoreductase [Ktedonobacteraceae bacterium]
MATNKHVSFGIKTAPQHNTYEEMLTIWQEADELPIIEHAWNFDHFMPLGNDPTGPCLEGWTLLAALAARTKRVRVGVMVTGNTYRHPAVLANMATTIDIISGGRLDFGIGAGWNELEHNAYGIPLYKTGERIRRFGEACEVIRLLWTERTPSFEGKYYQLKEAYCEPKPIQKPYPPFVIGGSGEKLTLRIVAQYASIWNFAGGTTDEFKHKMAVLDEHCAAIGRDPNSIQRSVQLVVNYQDWEETRQRFRSFIEAGANHVIANLRPPYPERVVHKVVEEVIEPITRG